MRNTIIGSLPSLCLSILLVFPHDASLGSGSCPHVPSNKYGFSAGGGFCYGYLLQKDISHNESLDSPYSPQQISEAIKFMRLKSSIADADCPPPYGLGFDDGMNSWSANEGAASLGIMTLDEIHERQRICAIVYNFHNDRFKELLSLFDKK